MDGRIEHDLRTRINALSRELADPKKFDKVTRELDQIISRIGITNMQAADAGIIKSIKATYIQHKTAADAKQNALKRLFVRIFGSSSDRLVNRLSEIENKANAPYKFF